MKNLFARKSPENVPEDHLTQTDDSLNELRKLLVGSLQSQVEEIQELLKNQGIHPEEVSKILPEAIMIRSSRDNQILRAMEPITEEAIKTSIERDPRVLVDVFVPVMLPAIKKAITSLIREMIQTFSATLEHGLSMRGLKWRFEAFKTKKPFGEVALLHSLIYQVEQIFLIHKDSGLVLQHVASDEAVTQDPDMVSGMLTAIQDFVRDSFGGGKDDSLENLQFGDRSVWIEQTSQAVVAAVVWGNAPEEFRSILRETLDAIHFKHIDTLRSFDGDTAPFEAEERLSDCLKSQFKSKEKNSFLLWVLLTVLIVCIGYWSFFFIRDHIRWKDCVERLHNEPGIVITETGRKSGRYYIFGLRDPLSENPGEILEKTKLEPEKMRFNWELYHSSHPIFIIRRIRSILRPPETVTFELKNSILHARGTASYEWVVDAEKLAETIPGISGFRSDDIVVIDLKAIETSKEQIEKTLFFFDKVSAKIRSGQEDTVRELVRHIQETDHLAQILDKDIRIEITGHTDSTGSNEKNLEISQKRAEELFSIFVSQGVRPELFTVTGAGSSALLREENSEADREFNRCVSFKMTLKDKESRPVGRPLEENGVGDKTSPDLPSGQNKAGDKASSDLPSGQNKAGDNASPDLPSERSRSEGAEFGPL